MAVATVAANLICQVHAHIDALDAQIELVDPYRTLAASKKNVCLCVCECVSVCVRVSRARLAPFLAPASLEFFRIRVVEAGAHNCETRVSQ